MLNALSKSVHTYKCTTQQTCVQHKWVRRQQKRQKHLLKKFKKAMQRTPSLLRVVDSCHPMVRARYAGLQQPGGAASEGGDSELLQRLAAALSAFSARVEGRPAMGEQDFKEIWEVRNPL
jgi:hypothetical protein